MGEFSIAWRLHDAQFWGTPQRRKRIALIADLGGRSAPEILFERKGLRWDPEQVREQGETFAEGTESCFGKTGEPIPIEGNGYRPSHAGNGWGEQGDPQFTLNSVEHHAVAYGRWDKDESNCSGTSSE